MKKRNISRVVQDTAAFITLLSKLGETEAYVIGTAYTQSWSTSDNFNT